MAVAEKLSLTPEDYLRGELNADVKSDMKLNVATANAFYQQLPSLQSYCLIDSRSQLVDVFPAPHKTIGCCMALRRTMS